MFWLIAYFFFKNAYLLDRNKKMAKMIKALFIPLETKSNL